MLAQNENCEPQVLLSTRSTRPRPRDVILAERTQQRTARNTARRHVKSNFNNKPMFMEMNGIQDPFHTCASASVAAKSKNSQVCVLAPTAEDRRTAKFSRFNLPRRLPKAKYPPIPGTTLQELAITRSNLSHIAPLAFLSLLGTQCAPFEEASGKQAEVISHCPDGSRLAPTHVIRVVPLHGSSSSAAYFPVHSAFVHAFLARVPELPASHPLNLYVPVMKGGRLEHDKQFARGLVPMQTWRVPNVDSFPAILQYIYFQRSIDIYHNIFGQFCEEFGDFFSAPTEDVEQEIVHRLSAEHSASDIAAQMLYLKGMVDNANALGLACETFFTTCQTSWRILSNALLA